jgi:type I restriction enzyme S subunit
MAAPKIRFKEFSENWGSKKIIELADYVDYRGKTPKKVESGVLLVTAKNIKQGYLDYSASQEFIEESAFDDVMRRGKVELNDVLITTEAPLGNVASVDRTDIALAQRVIKYRGKTGLLDNLFLKQKFLSESFQEILKSKATGGTVQGIKGSVLHQIPLIVPSKEEQTKIATFLSAVDEKISQLSQKLHLLGQYKQGMMHKLFSQQLRFKADDGSEFGDWEDKPLNEIACKNTIKNKDGSITEVLTNSAIQGIIKQSDYFEREIVTESNLIGYYLVNVNDFVYNPRISVHAPVGPIKRNKKCLGIMSPLYTVFTIKTGNLNYLEYFFDCDFWHDYVKSVANSGARHDRMNITNKDFFEMPILYPCLKEQTKIANFLSAIDQKIDVVSEQLEQAKLWKKGLLQQMFV